MAHINTAGLNLIKSFESCELFAYPDSAGVWTIGWGHTQGVTRGMTCTQEQADAWLEQDVHEAELSVQGLVEVTLTPNQFSALVSFEYNTGGLAGSTMLRYLNEGNFAGAAEEFPLWDWAGGVQLPGLDRRRAAEKALFLTP